MTEPAGSTETAETSSGRLAFGRQGSGEPLVLLHPLALSKELWTRFAGALADEFEVFSFDLRGHGESSWDGTAFSIADMAVDLAEALESIGLPAVHVLGMSMGGSTAVTFAGMYPERVRSLVLVDTTAWYGEDAMSAWTGRAAKARDVPRAEQLPFQVDRWFSEEFRAAAPDEVDRVTRIFLGTDSAAHAAASMAMGGLDSRYLLPSVRAATLVIVGEHDYATPPTMAERLAQGIDGAELLVVPGLRHMSLVERPALSEVVRGHLHGRSTTDSTLPSSRG